MGLTIWEQLLKVATTKRRRYLLSNKYDSNWWEWMEKKQVETAYFAAAGWSLLANPSPRQDSKASSLVLKTLASRDSEGSLQYIWWKIRSSGKQSATKNRCNVGLSWLSDCAVQKRLHSDLCLENKQAGGKTPSSNRHCVHGRFIICPLQPSANKRNQVQTRGTSCKQGNACRDDKAAGFLAGESTFSEMIWGHWGPHWGGEQGKCSDKENLVK